MGKIPDTNTPWMEKFGKNDYASIPATQIRERPIIAWFCRRNKRGVRVLVKMDTFSDGDIAKDVWVITSDDGRTTTCDPCTLKRALGILPNEATGWKICEFKTSAEYHQAVLDYLQ